MSRMAGGLVGQSVLRIEDDRILVGRGRYVDDIKLPHMLHGAFLRSTVAHARLVSVEVERARAMPGVVAVLTGEDVQRDLIPLQFPVEMPNMARPTFWSLAVDKVRHVGDPIALVVAESRYLAEDACDEIEVEYDYLDPVANVAHSKDPGRPLVFEELGTNQMFHEDRVFGDIEAAFAKADRVVRHSMSQQRVTHVPIETRGIIADYRPPTDEFVVYAACQGPHHHRHQLAAILQHPADRMRVISPDVGGSFGQKALLNREESVVTLAAKLTGRPVKWIEDRVENLTASPQAREEDVEIAAAITDDGDILGLDVTVIMDQGSYTYRSYHAAFLTRIMRTVLPGPYRIPAMRWHCELWATNKPVYGPYRGPWAAESLIRETLIDLIAHELGVEPNDIRRRNLIALADQPTAMVTGPTLEGVAAMETLQHVEAAIDIRGFRERQRKARPESRLLGVGVSSFIEAAPGPPGFNEAVGFEMPWEHATAQLEPDGRLTIFSGQNPHGQGHETTLTQIAAEEFGVPMERVRLVFGDTATTPFHPFGTGGSRAASQASGAVKHVTRAIRATIFETAGEMLEISVEDLAIVDGKVTPVGSPDLGIPLAQLGAMSYYGKRHGTEPGFRTFASFEGPRRGGWAHATHACFVEIDAETGSVKILRYIVAEDCGTVINPGIVDGQIRGGVAQGIGQVLFEHCEYDEDANAGSGTFLNYLIPTAVEIPSFEIIHVESEPLDEVNFRGVGEGGTINAPPALVNAISDALGGVPITALPLTPERILELIDATDARP